MAKSIKLAAAAETPNEAPQEAEPVGETKRDTSKDHGNWKYQPWSGVDRWVNDKNNQETFVWPPVRPRQ